jgi:hypothetical protein
MMNADSNTFGTHICTDSGTITDNTGDSMGKEKPEYLRSVLATGVQNSH